MADANEAQRAYWNSPVGERWAAANAVMETLLSSVIPPIVDRAEVSAGDSVIDVGCGSGALTFYLASRVAPGTVTGVDISRPLLALARSRIAAERLTNVVVLEADAEDEPFAPETVAAVVSRFGTMFFSDPAAAFGNLRRALVPGGRLSIAAWGPLAQNPWFALPREAAEARLGPAAPPEPRAPGPFAFDDADHLASLLERAGFAGVAVDAVNVMLRHPDAEAVVGLATTIGPAAALIREREASAEDVAAIAGAIAAALAPFREGDGIAVPALVHLGSGKRPA